MNYTDIVMTIENYKGTEYNYLQTAGDAAKNVLKSRALDEAGIADFFMELGKTAVENPEPGEGGWATVYLSADHTISMSYCHGRVGLVGFLEGNFNDMQDNWSFDHGECSLKCIRFLSDHKISEDGEILGLPEYEYKKVEHEFRQGEELLNLNGSRYKVLQCISPDNLILLDMRSGQFAVGLGTGMFERRLKADRDEVACGIEWEHGLYLGNMPSQIDFSLIRQRYGEERDVQSIYEYRHMQEERFSKLKLIEENEKLPASVRDAAVNAMYEEYMTGKLDVFLDNLNSGKYDRGFTGMEERKEDRCR